VTEGSGEPTSKQWHTRGHTSPVCQFS